VVVLRGRSLISVFAVTPRISAWSCSIVIVAECSVDT
jgi:hypothetical protein